MCCAASIEEEAGSSDNEESQQQRPGMAEDDSLHSFEGHQGMWEKPKCGCMLAAAAVSANA